MTACSNYGITLFHTGPIFHPNHSVNATSLLLTQLPIKHPGQSLRRKFSSSLRSFPFEPLLQDSREITQISKEHHFVRIVDPRIRPSHSSKSVTFLTDLKLHTFRRRISFSAASICACLLLASSSASLCCTHKMSEGPRLRSRELI